MASAFDSLSSLSGRLAKVAEQEYIIQRQIYDKNRHRIYSLSFWMTDNELTAEELMESTFRRAFAGSRTPSTELLDEALISELRALLPIGTLTLNCAPASAVEGVRRNAMRIHLERAVVQLPATERMIFLMHDVEGYDHARIGRCLSLNENDCQYGLHQARLRMRELLARMAS